MSKKKKPQHIGTVMAEMLSDSFAELAEDNKFWISKRSKDDSNPEYINVGSGLDIDALSEEFSDDMYFNLWADVEDLTKAEMRDLAEELAGKFYATDYVLGTKFPHTSKDGNKVSFRILERN